MSTVDEFISKLPEEKREGVRKNISKYKLSGGNALAFIYLAAKVSGQSAPSEGDMQEALRETGNINVIRALRDFLVDYQSLYS